MDNKETSAGLKYAYAISKNIYDKGTEVLQKLIEENKRMTRGDHIKRKTIDFQTFWDAYGLKRDRIAAERAWRRLSAKDQKAAYAGIQAYREACQRMGIATMYAQGYLNHRRWEDEAPSGSLYVATPSQPSPTPDCQPDMEIW